MAHRLCALGRPILRNLDAAACTKDPSKASPLDSDQKRRRPVHEDLKDAVATKVPREKLAVSGFRFLKAHGDRCPKLGYEWSVRSLMRYQASSWQCAAAARTVTLCIDAKRIGCPAEDTLVGAACVNSGADKFLIWPPPQVIVCRFTWVAQPDYE